jgi:hypothetical protein
MTERPSPGEQLAGIAGLALILTMFLFAWYGFDLPAGAPHVNGLDAFDAFDDWFNIILVFAAFGGIMLGLFGGGVARLPISLSVITTVLAGLGTIVLVIYIISPPGTPGFGGVVEVDLSREFGLFLGLVELIALTLGAYMTMQEEGVDFGSAADRLSGPGGGGQDRGTEQHPQHQAPPPPPAQDPYQQQPPAQDPYQQPPAAQDPYQQPPPPPPGS